MSGLRVLCPERDRETWVAAWMAWPEREPAAHPAYCRAMAEPGDTPVGLLFEHASGTVLYPLMLRDVPGSDAGDTDLADPYGYGGPFVLAGDATAVAPAFWEALEAWAGSERAVSLFGRPSLFPEQVLPWPQETAQVVGTHIVVDLAPSTDELWMAARHKVRKNVKRARRSGISVTVDLDGAHLDQFVDIYESTLDRREAADRYYFGRAVFERLVQRARGTFAFFHAWDADGALVSTELVLTSKHHLYSFLGGTRASAFADRPNDLLKWQVIEWGKQTGRTHFVLGAGAVADDGIYRYKLAFAPTGEVPFVLGRRTLNSEASHRLVAERVAREPGWSARAGWFPAYRA